MEKNWQPPSSIPLILDHVQSILPTIKNQLKNLKEIEKKPCLFSDGEINRTFKVFKEFHKNNRFLMEQCNHWLEMNLSEEEKKKIDQIMSIVNEVLEVSTEIILRAERYRKNTINKLLERGPAELALEMLLRNLN